MIYVIEREVFVDGSVDADADVDRTWLVVPLFHFNFNELQVTAIHSNLGGSGGKLFVWLLIIDENGPGPMVFTARTRILKDKDFSH